MSEKKSKSRGLGRGLSALMADVRADEPADQETRARPSDTQLPIEKLAANPNQPRRYFAEADLDDLTSSIKEKGILQPLIVRPLEEDRYEIVAGERRWRAAQQAQLHEVPVLIRELTDTEVLEVAIIENIQRADLNAIEEATGYRQLMDRFGHTQEKVAEALGKSRSHIANLLRLLTLPEEVLGFVKDGRLSAGHARALVGHDDASQLARQIVAKGLSVRETESLVKSDKTVNAKAATPKPLKDDKDPDTKALEGDLSATIGMSVKLSHKPGQEKGQMVISYSNLDDLDTLCRLLSTN